MAQPTAMGIPKQKKAMNPFILFRTTNCRKLKAANPDFTNSDISRVLGDLWQRMTVDQREPYVLHARRIKAIDDLRYARANREFATREPRPPARPPAHSHHWTPADIPPKVKTTILPIPADWAVPSVASVGDRFFEYDRILPQSYYRRSE